ncbi:MAG TPA: M18 family aminopeptidase, partial [Clostridiales bacterium]|nr:M18 family aminopeptidase [Clostridiales bacterium]
KFDLQTELRPFVAQSPSGEPSFLNYAAKAAGIPNRRILSFDIVLYDAAPAGYAGLHDEFLSSPHLDDCEMAYALTAGAVSEDAADHSFVAFVYDHEECGSASDRGAQSGVFEALLERLCGKLGYSREDLFRTMARSVIFSADMAHAAHPSYPQTGDPDTKVRLNRGPVLKLNANQSYATSASGSAYFKKLCTESGIPYQEYVNRSTIRGGRTIGPMLSAKSGMIAVDIGNPLLAMHSAREFGGTEDLYHMRRLFSAFF